MNRAVIAGESPALCSTNGRPPMSYSGLVSLIKRTGDALQTRGITSGDRVALFVENGPIAASAFLAISAQTVVAPLNPAMKAGEIRQALESLKANALVVLENTHDKVIDIATELGITVFILQEDLTATGEFTLTGPSVPDTELSEPTDIALFLHTSGTTGKPKRVPLTHSNLLTSARNIADSLALVASDRSVNIMPLFHIHGLVAGLIAPLISGAAVLATTGLEPDKFLHVAADFGATWYTGVPTMHQGILAAAQSNLELTAQCAFRFIRASSSALPSTVRAGLEETFKTSVVEAYGMTEAAHQMTSQRPDGRKARGSVGSPNGVEVAVLDASGIPLDTGLEGEVAIRGANVMAGYDDNPAANADTFTNGWMRTGDIGRFDEDGDLFLVGRIKEIIKRGGFQISPVEVEDALLAQPGILQAVAFGVPHETLGQDLVCAVVPEPGAQANETDLRNSMFELLSDYKVPSRILIVPAIPVGPTGKLQRIGLDQAFSGLIFTKYSAQNGPLEELLAHMIEEVVPGKRIGATDDFFLSGGDSLSGARLISRLRGAFGIGLPLGTLFRYPTIIRLARHLETVEDGKVLALIEETLIEIDDVS